MAADVREVTEELKRRGKDVFLDTLDLLESPVVLLDNSIDLGLKMVDAISLFGEKQARGASELIEDLADHGGKRAKNGSELFEDLATRFREFNQANRQLIEVPEKEKREV